MTAADYIKDDSDASQLVFKVGQLLDDGLLVTDPAGIISSANSAAVRFMGEGLVGKSLQQVFGAEVIDAEIDFNQINPKGHEFFFQPESAVPRQFKIRVTWLDDNQILVLLLDMTLQRNLEKVRRDFVANVSHELRSPLTSLAGFIETMLTTDIEDAETTTRFLTIMDEESRRMSRLIDDLLSLSRVEVDEHIIPTETVPLFEVLRTVISTLDNRARGRGMSIRLNDARPKQSATTVMFGYADEINEVFHNLIENALKYGFDNSQVLIDVKMIAENEISVAVSNDGDPIDEKHISRLTERFYRVDKARSRQIGGTGLGLAIVKHIVNRHRGHLDITSTAAGRTTFEVKLPVFEKAGI